MSRAALAVLGLVLLAAACGKVGPVRAPGPQEAITYPRQYPAPERRPDGTVAPATTPTTGPTAMPTMVTPR
ncbi:hypothetical protein GWK16_08105 [Roseomonas sp. JC162]|uniref:Lipoprotein n=1 Tax=Neoroseomonas marina TaxID=1232220 RepID=A0A848ECH5_9PROT|nr:hypothetical protein [Neoroseomonas marina]NMJ41199.1 hypothetical protein [Neoroseomonas marina]